MQSKRIHVTFEVVLTSLLNCELFLPPKSLFLSNIQPASRYHFSKRNPNGLKKELLESYIPF